MKSNDDVGRPVVFLGDEWLFERDRGILRRQRAPFDEIRLNARLSKVLNVFVSANEDTVSTQTILKVAWKGRVVSSDSVSTAIYQLRKFLSDSADSPKYIETIPNEGYRLVCEVNSTRARRFISPNLNWLAASGVSIFLVGALILFASVRDEPRTVYVPPVVNSTGIPTNDGASIVFRSHIMNAMSDKRAGIIATVSDEASSQFTLESEMVGCEAGPAVVFRLVKTDTQQHVWSQHFDINPEGHDSTVAKLAVQKVSETVKGNVHGATTIDDKASKKY